MIAAFVTKFEGLKLQRCRVGQDAQNTVDGNMITGRYARNLDSTITAFGFSGHSFMHGLAAGRALSELAWTGAYQSLIYRSCTLSAFKTDPPCQKLAYAKRDRIYV